jgi:hypothetical protein
MKKKLLSHYDEGNLNFKSIFIEHGGAGMPGSVSDTL